MDSRSSALTSNGANHAGAAPTPPPPAAASALTQLGSLMWWLGSVHAQAPEAPIMVVGTHAKSITAELLEERREQIEESFEGRAFYGQISSFKCVDSKEDGDEVFEALRAKVLQKQQQLDGFHSPVPLRWLRFLEVMSKSNKERVNLDEAREAAAHMQIAEEREFMLMLALFTNVGLLIHHDEDGLRDLVVLQPQWLLNVMRDMLCGIARSAAVLLLLWPGIFHY